MFNELKISVKRTCYNCEGKGILYSYKYNPHHKKSGKIKVEKINCFDCNGTGYVSEDIEFEKFAQLIVEAVLFRLNKIER
jgi:DnaJ-class molecular chaperone